MVTKSFADILCKHWKTVSLRPLAGDKVRENSLFRDKRHMLSTCAFPEYTELPGKLNKSERKPFVVPINELKRKARLQRNLRQEVREVNMRSPENGLLLKRLIPVAHEVYASRIKLFHCVSRLTDKVGVNRCRYPRDGPMSTEEIQAFGFWEKRTKTLQSIDLSMSELDGNGIQELAEKGLDAWEKLRSGAARLMQKYSVQVCGYCPEVQVGPKGHRARTCQAHKHQQRDGQHAWQEATVDDIVPPVCVWHVKILAAERL